MAGARNENFAVPPHNEGEAAEPPDLPVGRGRGRGQRGGRGRMRGGPQQRPGRRPPTGGNRGRPRRRAGGPGRPRGGRGRGGPAHAPQGSPPRPHSPDHGAPPQWGPVGEGALRDPHAPPLRDYSNRGEIVERFVFTLNNYTNAEEEFLQLPLVTQGMGFFVFVSTFPTTRPVACHPLWCIREKFPFCALSPTPMH